MAAKEGVQYVSCPVFGRPDAAKNKQLVIVMAGPVRDVWGLGFRV
jgi:3-hydroxyisobutyrate dehydrogenase-like beta-hydroxyacid dehydrogenase